MAEGMCAYRKIVMAQFADRAAAESRLAVSEYNVLSAPRQSAAHSDLAIVDGIA